MSISDLENNIKKYDVLKTNLSSILVGLNSSRLEVGYLEGKLKKNYLVNNAVTPVGERVVGLNGNLNETYDYIKNTILPAIDTAIAGAKADIEAEKQRIEEERQRQQEEEERIQREQALEEERKRKELEQQEAAKKAKEIAETMAKNIGKGLGRFNPSNR